MHLFFELLTVAVTSCCKLLPPLPRKDWNLELRAKISLLPSAALLRNFSMAARNKANPASEIQLSISFKLTCLVGTGQQMPHSFPSLGSHRDGSGNSLLSATPHPRYTPSVNDSYPEARHLLPDPSGGQTARQEVQGHPSQLYLGEKLHGAGP